MNNITIEVVKGGFVLSYPSTTGSTSNGLHAVPYDREVFTSQRKLNQKLKEVLDSLSTTPDDSKD